MQNAGQQFGQGGASSHQSAPFGHSESTPSGGSITSSLRQFRRKNEDKQHLNDTTTTTVAESHVARVPPHNHYPARQTAECYRYPQQYQDFNSPPVKFSEVTDPNQSLRENISSTVIQKTKDKEYMEMCNVQQPHMKQPFDHLNNQQSYPESNIHPHVPPHAQYVHKEAQVLPAYKPESQYFPKDSHYQQLPHQMQKYNMPAQIRKYPPGNDFLSKLRRIHPTMARSIMSDHHLQESQTPYQPMDQTRMYSPQTQRYMNYPPMPNNTYPPGYMSSQSYPNYPTSCSYTRSPQMGPRFPSITSHERSISPRRNYSENMTMPMNYGVMPHQKASPNFSPYTAPEYAQHYQHRRAPMSQEYYQQCRPNQYLPHQMTPQDISENRVTVSDSIKQYIENWADEETATELENNRHCKDGMRVRDDQSTETVYMINASELQYFENGIPLVTSDNTIPMVASENGQYIIKSGVSIENTSGMVRLVDNKNAHIMDLQNSNEERVVNLHIMDSPKQDCMLANKPNESNQRQTNEHLFGMTEKPRVVVHQNTVIQSGYQNIPRDNTYEDESDEQVRVGNSLPIITDSLDEVLNKSIKECRKETVDKNCSPINLDQLEEYKELSLQSSVICTNKNLEEEFVKEIENIQESQGTESSIKNMPFFDTFPENISSKVEDKNHIDLKCEVNKSEVEKTEDVIQGGETVLEEVSHADKQISANEKIGHPEVTTLTMENVTNCQEKLEPVISEECSAAPVPDKKIVIDEVVEAEAMEIESIDISTECQELTAKSNDEVDSPNNVKHNEIEINDLKEDKNSLLQTFSTKKFESTGEKPIYKRSRRIFSVDDIMNNIGKNLKPKPEKDILGRRHSLQSTKEFLDNEIANIFTVSELGKKHHLGGAAMEIVQEKSSKEEKKKVEETKEKENEVDEAKESISLTGLVANSLVEQSYKQDQDIVLEKTEEKMFTEQIIIKEIDNKNEPAEPAKSPCEPSEDTKPVRYEKTPEIPKLDFVKDEMENNITNKPEELFTSKVVKTDKCEEILIETNETIIPDSNEDYRVTEQEDSQHVIEKFVDSDVNILVGNPSGTVETASQTCCKHDHEVSIEDSFSQTVDSAQDTGVHLMEQKKADSGSDQNEIQYRSVIRVEESSVLLQIAGELVEVNVNTVNGKNIITVVPLSDTSILDFNDNYEAVINTEATDPLHIDNMVMESNDAFTEAVEYQAVDTEPEIVETTSEIIIGMDLSLEEEIKLDIAQPPKLCTKAAKKAYDSDLQIPSITTSEDVYDKIITEVYSGNDKVSSSKEHTNKNFKTERLVDSSRKLQKSKRFVDKIDKKLPFANSIKNRNQKEFKQQKPSEEDEFVPFKELIRARKLKKLKQQVNKINEDVTVDSTMKIDDITGENVELAQMETIKKSEADGKISVEKEASSKSSKIPNEDKLESKKDKRVPELKDKNKKTQEIVVEQKETSESTQKMSNGDEEKSKPASSEREEKKVEKTVKEIRKYNLDDPRLRGRSNGCSSKYPEGKRKLSLEEYNKRKRKLLASDKTKTDIKTEKISFQTKNCKSESSQGRIRSIATPDKINFQRPKSLDDLNSLKPKENKCTKRKLSLQCSPIKQNYFDWEETQSPKTNFQQNNFDKRFSEFRGLINISTNNKSKTADHSNTKSNFDVSGDEILQNYKEQVDFKLSSLKFEIPRVGKPTEKPPNNPFSKSESSSLMQRFLKDEKLTSEEMEKICKIISYKRLIQQMKKDKVPEPTTSKINPSSYEIHKETGERNTKLHLKKVSDKKRKSRFRNLHTQSNTESDDDVNDNRKSDYSVVQSNCLAGVVPKLIIKRKTEMPLPVVRLERLDLGLLANKRIRYVV